MGPAHACGLSPCPVLQGRSGIGSAGGAGGGLWAPFPWGWISGNRATSLLHPPGGKAVGFEGSRGVGTHSLFPIRSRALAITWLFRFQKKKLEKARKKKEEKKEAMLEKSLFQGGDGAGGAEVTPSPGGQHVAGWGSWSGASRGAPTDPGSGFTRRHGAVRRSGDTATHHHLTAQGTGSCRAGELWGQCHPPLGYLGGQRWPQ